MNANRLFLLCLLSSLASPSMGGDGAWERVIVRQNLSTKKDVPKPAFFHYTSPEEGPSSYAVGLGVQYAALSSDRVTLGPFTEYLRNTELDKEQDVKKLGLASEWQLRELTKKKKNSGVFIGNLNYKEDGVKNAESVQASLTYTHFWTGQQSVPKPNLYFPIGDRSHSPHGALGLLYSPSGGLEWERVYEADDSAFEGRKFRAYLDFGVWLYPGANALLKSLELELHGTFRRDFDDSTGSTDRSHLLFKSRLTYYFLDNEAVDAKAGVSLSFTDGEDPQNGFQDQEVWQFGLSFQVK